MKCKDCYHYEVCEYHIDEETKLTIDECEYFKDKSNIIELLKHGTGGLRMIEGFNGMYTLTCDVCGEEYPETFFDFYEAVNEKKQAGWKSRKIDGKWEDMCDMCLLKEQENQKCD